jgi:hypothetical protein
VYIGVCTLYVLCLNLCLCLSLSVYIFVLCLNPSLPVCLCQVTCSRGVLLTATKDIKDCTTDNWDLIAIPGGYDNDINIYRKYMMYVGVCTCMSQP